MHGFLRFCGVIAFVLSLGTCVASRGAVHEIAAIIWILIGVVSLAAAAILGELEKHRPPPPPKA